MDKPYDLKEVGKRIRKIRISLGLSMEEFAKKIDEKAKSGTVSNWETGKNLPNNERLKKIADLGNINVEYLLSGNPFDNLPIEEQDKYIESQVESYLLAEFKENHYPQLESFLEVPGNFYVNQYKLNSEDKKLLYDVAMALFGGREKNYPSDEQIKKEFEDVRHHITQQRKNYTRNNPNK